MHVVVCFFVFPAGAVGTDADVYEYCGEVLCNATQVPTNGFTVDAAVASISDWIEMIYHRLKKRAQLCFKQSMGCFKHFFPSCAQAV